jgi:hypothetical protein
MKLIYVICKSGDEFASSTHSAYTNKKKAYKKSAELQKEFNESNQDKEYEHKYSIEQIKLNP